MPVVFNIGGIPFFGPPFAVPVDFVVDVVINPGNEAYVPLQDHTSGADGDGGYYTYTIKLPYPTPIAVNFILGFKNYSTPTVIYRQLAKHVNDTPAGSYRFPGKKSDLEPGQYWSGKSNWISSTHGGNERFAYDIGARRWDEDDEVWTRIYDGTTACNNEDWIVWDKPIYAIADGIVESVTDGKSDRDPTYGDCVGTPSEGTNSINVRYGDEVVRYLHLKEGTAVVAVGDVV